MEARRRNRSGTTTKPTDSLALSLRVDESVLREGGLPMNDSSKPSANVSEHILNQPEPVLGSDGVPSAGDWRELARSVQHETDPDKLSALVQQLIAAFDREKLQKHPFMPAEEPDAAPGLG
jgi:hypothetical protein